MAIWTKQVSLSLVNGQWSAEYRNLDGETIVTPRDIRQIMVVLRTSHRKLLSAYRMEQRRKMEAPQPIAPAKEPEKKTPKRRKRVRRAKVQAPIEVPAEQPTDAVAEAVLTLAEIE